MFWFSHIAVANNGNVFYGGNNFANAIPIGVTTEHLTCVATMHGDGGNADIFKLARKVRGHKAIGVPTQANFCGDRHAAVGVLGDRVDNALGQLHRVAHVA